MNFSIYNIYDGDDQELVCTKISVQTFLHFPLHA